MTTSNDDLMNAYRTANREADAAREQWNAFLPTTPLSDGELPAQTGNIGEAYRTVVAAEKKEAEARDAVFAQLRGDR